MADQRTCDIIMKGGITSGVVYPEAILRLSESFHFKNIGGTSAGAIAAVITAAAEYNRAGGGYDVVRALPGEIQHTLKSLFQPSPGVRPVFDAALHVLDKNYGKAAGALARGFWLFLLVGSAPALGLALVAAMAGNGWAAAALLVLGLLCGLILFVIGVGVATVRRLGGLDFGFCPGRTQNPDGPPGLSDWLAEKIEVAAGRMVPGGKMPDAPLTFADIWRKPTGEGNEQAPAINLRMMTTNLTLRRPNNLPSMDDNHYFQEQEFRRVFPDWIVDYLVKASATVPTKDPLRPGYYRFPSGGELPLIVAARMSLSFPILFSAVPLYRFDYVHRVEDDPPSLVRMLFSDGGLSSNFPVHFFDALLPRRPTFGVSLEELDKQKPDKRVVLPMRAGGIWLDGVEIKTIFSFLMALVNAAKDWQDRLQSTLPGYRERIASIYLKDTEGGLNLTMPASTIAELTKLGDRGGALMTGAAHNPDDKAPFDFDDHRWRRYLVAFARIEETLLSTAQVWGKPDDPNSFSHFIHGYMTAPKSYYGSTTRWRNEVFDRFDSLMTLVAGWDKPLATARGGEIPRPVADFRITPKL